MKVGTLISYWLGPLESMEARWRADSTVQNFDCSQLVHSMLVHLKLSQAIPP